MKKTGFIMPLLGTAFIWLFSASTLFAQTGTVSGTVFEAKGGDITPLPFAQVVLLGTNQGASTDFDGKYSFLAAPGKYRLVVKSFGLMGDTIAITVVENKVSSQNINMRNEGIDLTGFTKVAKANRENINFTLMEQRESAGVGNIMGAKKLVESGSGNVGAGLQKVAGLSVVGSKHVFVRGMGDRYNTAYLNGLPLPSSDPDKKVMPLDIFPTSIVSNLGVNKAFTSGLYGDFAGGAIDIRTKQISEDTVLQIKLGTGFNSSSTFKDFQSYNGGQNDYFGRDDGTRDIPASVVPQNDEYSSFSEGNGYDFGKNFNPQVGAAPVNTSMSIFGSTSLGLDQIKEGAKLGLLLLASHTNSTSIRTGNYRVVNRQDEVRIDYDLEDSRRNTNSSILASATLEASKNHQITVNSLFVNTSLDNARDTRGTHFDYASSIFSRRYTYRQNELFSNQILGNHKFLENEKMSLKWGVMNSTAQSKDPDRRQLVWLYQPGTAEANYTINAIDVNDNHRFFSALEEKENSAFAEANYQILTAAPNDKEEDLHTVWAITAGINYKSKNRDFDYRQFNYAFSKPISDYYPTGIDINNPDLFLNNAMHDAGAFEIEEQFDGASAYNVTQDIMAPYFSTLISPTEKWDINIGVRMEDGQQVIRYRDQVQSSVQKREIINGTDFLPSIIGKYETGVNSTLRIAGSQTISRPGFREVAPFQYIEFFAGVQSIGNPELVNGNNLNGDVRWEVYPSPGELIGITGFAKRLSNPIERVSLATASGQLVSYSNSKQATLKGVELEYLKRLGNLEFIGDSSILANITIGFNASYLQSKIEIDSNQTVGGVSLINTNPTRPLQGASPYLVNFDVTYEKWLRPEKVKFSSTLAYNVFGKRLYSAGISGIGDIYETPVNTVNFTSKLDMGKVVLGLTARNLLNPNFKLVQETDAGSDLPVNTYKRGVVFNFNLTYNFL